MLWILDHIGQFRRLPARWTHAPKSQSLGSLMRCGCAEEAAPRRSAQQRRAAFQQRAVAAPAPEPAEAPTEPVEGPLMMLDSAPSVVVSDYSQEDGGTAHRALDDWETTMPQDRRLSICSSCSTVSSCGRDLSQRGSLVDLEAEGLVLGGDGRLERALTPDLRHHRRSLDLHRQRSLDLERSQAQEPWQRSLDIEWKQARPRGWRCALDLEWSPSLHPTWRRTAEPPWRQPRLPAWQPSLDLEPDPPPRPPRVPEVTESRGHTLTVTQTSDAAAQDGDALRKVSDCSCSSVSTISQEDEEEELSTTLTANQGPMRNKRSESGGRHHLTQAQVRTCPTRVAAGLV
ncbi:uncharacterized protein LOC119094386 [Pollicipes pollicipes]|uniref:uncharacterized protein LOC119094386 n=1 Tax=Pollicipes pollicipes TaxID=41117 RepID=UPI001884ABB4|nr:uncharacterized protein LOC119094386 [Pollicipes pollicipes]